MLSLFSFPLPRYILYIIVTPVSTLLGIAYSGNMPSRYSSIEDEIYIDSHAGSSSSSGFMPVRQTIMKKVRSYSAGPK